MSKIKSLILGSAAGLVAIGGAQAADLPVKAKAVEYVKVCSLYGAGFYYIPGTDTCIKLGGYLRAEVQYNSAPTDNPYVNGGGGQHDRWTNQYQSRARIMVQIDTRTATEYGVVRTFASFGPQFSTTGVNGASSADTLGNGGMRVEAAFIQFAGFTFGRSSSAYALPWNGAPGNIFSGLFGGPNFDAGVNNIQYTWQFGNGVSASLGIDEQSTSNRTQVLNADAAIAANGTQTATSNSGLGWYAGTSAPDVVGNIRLDQAWGLIQVSAAAHQVTGSYFGATAAEVNGHPEDKWGFAVTGALQLNNIPTGAGDNIRISGTYAEGATRYVLGNSGATPANFAVFGNGNGLTYGSVALATVSDAVYGITGTTSTGGSLQLTKSYGINGAFNHNWNKNWSTSLFGSYSKVDYNAVASTAYCNRISAAANGIPVATCNPDFNVSQLGLLTVWTPVKNLSFSAEALWTRIDTGFSGTAPAYVAGGVKPTAAYNFANQDVFSGVFRVQRNF